MGFAEGPVYFADGRYLLFSDIPNSQILRWQEVTGRISVFRDRAEFPDGNTRDRQGRLRQLRESGMHAAARATVHTGNMRNQIPFQPLNL